MIVLGRGKYVSVRVGDGGSVGVIQSCQFDFLLIITRNNLHLFPTILCHFMTVCCIIKL